MTTEPRLPAIAPVEYDRAREAVVASGTITLNISGSVPCPACQNEAHLHTGSGTRDCIATMTRVLAQLHREVHND